MTDRYPLITLERADLSLPPHVEYESVSAWLNALPPDATILVTLSDPARTIPTPVRHVIEGLRAAPAIRAMFDAERG
jgi:hypothetical protein